MTTTLTFTGELTVTSCWCGIRLAIPDSLYRQARQNKKAVFCPLGHTFAWSETEADRLKKRLAAAERTKDWYADALSRTQHERDASERSARAYKGHVTRLRNRIANGVCPVAGCHRHFDNVQAHIEGQHPEWAAEHPEVLS